eukprot:4628819-Pleurochrysis_carterae.AAC.1
MRIARVFATRPQISCAYVTRAYVARAYVARVHVAFAHIADAHVACPGLTFAHVADRIDLRGRALSSRDWAQDTQRPQALI